MDELTIAGKRFISARRAAREHRYHSDYIGQLIRSGKVVGQKVGRAWYVSEESLLAYFNGESSVPALDTLVAEASMPAQQVESAIEVVQPAGEPIVEVLSKSAFESNAEAPEEKVEKIEAVKTKEPEPKIFVEKEVTPIAVRVEEKLLEPEPSYTGLTYLSDEPEVQPIATKEEREVQVAPRAKRSRLLSAFVLVVFAVVIFGASAALGSYLNATVGLEGQTASSGYSLSW